VGVSLLGWLWERRGGGGAIRKVRGGVLGVANMEWKVFCDGELRKKVGGRRLHHYGWNI